MFNWLYKREAEKLAALLKVREGFTIADVGAGKGGFSFASAKRVGPSGKVYAVEFDPKRLKIIRKKAAGSGLTNVEIIASTEASANLPANSCDAIFTRHAYHHFTHPAEINASMLAALKSGGRLAVIDFPPKFLLTLFSPVKGVPQNRGGHGILKDIAARELTCAGFKLICQIDNWPWACYCLLFQKP